jgi:hypothetical protein
VIPVGKQAIRVRHSGLDRYGDPVAGEDRTPIGVIGLAPRVGGPGTNSSEITDRGRDGLREGLTAYLDIDVDLRFGDQIEIDGQLWDIEGEPGRWESPLNGWRPGQEVELRRLSG